MALPAEQVITDILTVTEATATGGLLQSGDEDEGCVCLELVGTEGTVRAVMGLDTYFRLMAHLEHAGKVALLASSS